MLVDIADTTIADPHMALVTAIIGGTSVEHRGRGMYVIGHFNFDANLGKRCVSKYPFDPYERVDRRLPFEQRSAAARAIEAEMGDAYPADYGVCDTPEQLIEKFPILDTDPRPFVVSFTKIAKAEQPPMGGWRWHKWGPYIGDHTPTTEYLHDEPDIDDVWVYHVYEVTS